MSTYLRGYRWILLKSNRISSDVVALFAFVTPVTPIAHMLLASPGFSYREIRHPAGGPDLRGVFHECLVDLAIAGVIGAVGLAASGRTARHQRPARARTRRSCSW